VTFIFRHPSYYAKIKKENRLTNSKNYGKENDDEKIQSKTDRSRNRSGGSNTIRQRARFRTDRK